MIAQIASLFHQGLSLPDVPDDYTPSLTAIVTGIMAIGGILVTAFFAWMVRIGSRLRRMEVRDRLSYLYIRQLIDHIYRHTDTARYPLPEPPEGLFDPDKVE